MARSEVERRRTYIDQLNYQLPQNGQHPFVQLVTRCLQNEQLQRPTAEELITSLVEMKANIEGPYGEVSKADAVRQVVMMRALRKRDTEVREKNVESAAKDVEIQQLLQELEHEQVCLMMSVLKWWSCMLSLYQAERTRAEEQLQQKDAEIQQRDGQLQQKDSQIQQKEVQIRQKDTELGQARTQLQQKTAQLNSIQLSLQVHLL